MERRAKIVATIGPACQDEAVLRSLVQAGMNVARLNFSHGSYADHAAVYQRLRKLSEEAGRPITILQDLQGPKIRTGEIGGGQALLQAGQRLTLTSQPVLGDSHLVSIDFPDLAQIVSPGGRILLDDGNLELVVEGVSGGQVQTRVVVGGALKPHKGVNLPGARMKIPGLTEKDEADLAFGLKLGIDAVAVSFVRTREDVSRVREAIERLAPERQDTPIIAKLERPEALDNLEAIVEEADGVMVARGDLGVEMPAEEVPIAQKRIIETANQHAKIVITATQMLDSMINNPRPTRAEASDVANAIFDGSDAVMLSGETAAGKYPIQSVEMMDAIVRQAEEHIGEWGRWGGEIDFGVCEDDTYFTTRAACALAQDRNVAALIVFTHSGRTARILCKQRPGARVLALTANPATYYRLGMYWGITPQRVAHVETLEEVIRVMEEAVLASGAVRAGQQVVLVCGYPIQTGRPTNLALLHTIGEGKG